MLSESWLGEEAAKERANRLYRRADADRLAYLDNYISYYGRCQFCTKRLSDGVMIRKERTCSQAQCRSQYRQLRRLQREMEIRMAEPAIGNPRAVNYLYIVGGEDSIFRDLKRKVVKMGQSVSGHASVRWKSPFVVPAVTTHILIVTDNVTKMLRDCGEKEAKRLGVPLLVSPARTKPDNTFELMKKEGVFNPTDDITPILSRSDMPTEGSATLGEMVAAKGQKLEATTEPEPPASPPEPPAAPPEQTTTSTATTAPETSAPTAPAAAAPTEEPPVYTHAERARQILTETKGKLSNRDISGIISEESHLECTMSFIQEIRKKLKLPQAPLGPKSKEVKGLIEYYSKQKTRVKLNGTAPTKQAVTSTPTVEAKPAEHTPPPSLTQQAPPAPPVEEDMPEGDDIADAFYTSPALPTLERDIIKPHNLRRLVLVWEDGAWQEPEIEKVVVTKKKVKLKR